MPAVGECLANIRRSVPIKVIKLGTNPREVIARFESERQAAALTNHPNVDRVRDAGAIHAGQPYLVEESAIHSAYSACTGQVPAARVTTPAILSPCLVRAVHCP